jgi:MFS family permease
MTRGSIAALGVVQCLNWGVLYYAFGALLMPVQQDLGVSQPVVAGAFSLGLLISATLAPRIGRLCDAGHGLRAIRVGALVAAALLWLWALAPHVVILYVVWAGLGACMAATLYEPAFAIVGQSIRDPRARLRALSAVTVFGGLASTALLPATALLIDRWHWRASVAVLGVTMVGSAALTLIVRRSQPAGRAPILESRAQSETVHRPRLRAVAVLFSVASLSASAFAASAVAAFVERGLTPTVAATLTGLFGLLQLPGRLMLMYGPQYRAARLAIVSLSAQALGLGMIAAAPIAAIPLGVALLALGNGVLTLVRPHLVQSMFGMTEAGAHNGTIARGQQFARAIGPMAAIGLASYVGYQLTLVILAVALGTLTASLHAAIDQFESSTVEQEAL